MLDFIALANVGAYNCKTVSSNAVKSCTHIEYKQLTKHRQFVSSFVVRQICNHFLCVRKNTHKLQKISDFLRENIFSMFVHEDIVL